ncbi:MAG TPA: GUN4 domain-containing protein [Coleofasciculaceae cyanobacterium]
MAALCCPVCTTDLSETEMLCPTCGWDTSPLPEALVGTGSDRATIALLRARDQVRLAWAREFWQNLSLNAKLAHLEAQLKRARQERSHIYGELNHLQESHKALLQALSPQTIESLQQAQAQIQQQLVELQHLHRSANGVVAGPSAEGRSSPPSIAEPAPPIKTPDRLPDLAASDVDRNDNPFHLPEHRSPDHRSMPSLTPLTPLMPPAHGLPTEDEVTILQFVMPSPSPSPSPPVDRYGRLTDLLESQKWLEADRETTKVMLKVVGREGASWLRVEDIEQFPKGDLAEIDRLWTKNSQGHFGFRVQHEIWLEITGQTTSPVEAWCRFGDRLGWNNQKSRNFSLSAPLGHLPYCSAVGVWWCSGLFPQVISAALGSA